MRVSLRVKSALALCLCVAIVLTAAVGAGWLVLDAVEETLGSAFVRNATRYNRQRILTPVLRELALSQRLADSEVTRRWLLDESDPEKKALFFAEATRYREAFTDGSYFVISGASQGYYFNDAGGGWSDRPRYMLKAGDPADAWFFSTMKNTKDFNINVDPDTKLKVTKVWFNVVVRDGERNIGLAGTGLDLTTFLDRFIANSEAGVTPMVLDRRGAIQAHPDHSLIDYMSINEERPSQSLVFHLLNRPRDHEVMRDAMRRAEENPDEIPVFWAEVNGRPELFAVAFASELGWHVVTAVDLKAARVVDERLLWSMLLAAVALGVVLVVAATVAVNRILLAPLLDLTASARAMGAGNYSVQLPAAGGDEMGELTEAFRAMAERVRSHTDELEERVAERTRELLLINQRVAAANKQIGDSIRYASLIQNAILPDREMERALGDRHFVLWRPRDVVGGDFYVFRAAEGGCLIGVVDCAGHGVPGAFMTMIAHAAIDVAVETLGIADPAALLREVDARTRAMLQTDAVRSQVATHMDAGLAYVDFGARSVTFSGANVSLYACDGEGVTEIKGDRRAMVGKRSPAFANHTVPLDPRVTFYLTTDGLLDQAGGPKGYSFGNSRFGELLRRHARRPFAEQRAAFAEELAAYQGELPQRDDITVLSFRFADA
jgi:serine phosphatase RsbU (regulator of sigma subunit)